jgi:hypothetical protein
MPEPQSGHNAIEREKEDKGKPILYPTDKVVAILDTPGQASCAPDALVAGGFLESEIEILHGLEQAERLEETTGRRGFQDWWIRAFEKLRLQNAEIEVKDRYEQALRKGGTAIAVLAPTEERKDRAAELIRKCGGRFINFFGRLNIQRISG